MLKIDKVKEPEFFIKFKEKNKPKNWTTFKSDKEKQKFSELKQELKEIMLEKEQKNVNKLTQEISYYCPYCERKVTFEKNNSHIEHIKPRYKFPDLTFEYTNLLVCCVHQSTCGSKKGNEWHEDFINPVEENPELFFEYDIKRGEIISTEKNKKRAEKTIELLNLNERNLCERRKNFIIKVMKTGLENLDFFNDFPTLKKYLKENGEILKPKKLAY